MAKKGTPSLPLNLNNKLTPPLNPAKSRTIAVRILSMAMTGYYRTLRRPRQHRPLSMMKYDPVGTLMAYTRGVTLEPMLRIVVGWIRAGELG